MISATRLLCGVEQFAESGSCLEKCQMVSEQWLWLAGAEPFAFILLKCCKTFEYMNSIIQHLQNCTCLLVMISIQFIPVQK